MLAFLLAAALSGAPQAEPRIVEPDWAEVPTTGSTRALMPYKADAQNVSGRGVLRCGVTTRGRLTGCEIKSESPPGWGFGEAALKLAPRFRMKPLMRDGRATNEGVVTVPVNFWVHGKVLLDCALVEGRARGCTAVSESFPGRGMGAMAVAFAEGRKPGRHGTSVKAGRLRWRLDTPVPVPECAPRDTSFPCGGPES